jgi:exopolysaccharide biosynthesis polyprenyl glycosylphosphotransferase
LNSQISAVRIVPIEQRLETKGFKRDLIIFSVAADLVLVFASACFASVSFPTATTDWQVLTASALRHFEFLVLYAGFLILSCQVYKVYSGKETRTAEDEQRALIKAVVLATLLVAAVIYLSGVETVSTMFIGETVVLSSVAMMGWRFLRHRRIVDGLNPRNVIIVGAGPMGQDLENHLARNRHLGLAVKGYLDQRRVGDQLQYPERRSVTNKSTSPILGGVQDLAHVVRSHFIDEIFIATPENRDLVKHLIFEARRNGIDVRVIPDQYDGLACAAPIEYLGHIPLMSFCHQSVPTVGLLVKRCVDVLSSVVGLIVLAPILVAVAILVKSTSRGPVLYRSTRIGKKGRKFVCYKFRTMVENADHLRDSLHHLNEREEILFKIANDPRITSVGKFVRRYSIDELPQLVNVLNGDMSLVGPRPAVPREYEQYSPDHLRRLDVVPGITGLWQVAARKDPSFQNYIALDRQYVDNWSVWLDCKILVKTIAVVLAGTGQ